MLADYPHISTSHPAIHGAQVFGTDVGFEADGSAVDIKHTEGFGRAREGRNARGERLVNAARRNRHAGA